MSYDLEIAPALIPSKAFVGTTAKGVREKPAKRNRADLEVIVILLELAAITLSGTSDETFTSEQLYEEACSIGGEGITLEQEDVALVLDKAGFLKKAKKNVYRLK